MAEHPWDRPGIPHKGWKTFDVEDLGQDGGPLASLDYATCEMCGKERIRYVHVMEHDEYPDRLRVGCVCAENMSDDYVGPKEREKKLQSRATRRGRWLKNKWRESSKGNDYLNRRGHNIGVFRQASHWGFWIDGNYSRAVYDSQDNAKLALFDAFEETPDKTAAEDDYFDFTGLP